MENKTTNTNTANNSRNEGLLSTVGLTVKTASQTTTVILQEVKPTVVVLLNGIRSLLVGVASFATRFKRDQLAASIQQQAELEELGFTADALQAEEMKLYETPRI